MATPSEGHISGIVRERDQPSPERCDDACEVDPACAAFAYVLPVNALGAGDCFLKSVVPEPTWLVDGVSGVKR